MSKIDVKEISKLTLEKDEILLIQLAGNPSLCQLKQAQKVLDTTLPSEWKGRVLVVAGTVKMTKVKQKDQVVHGVNCVKVAHLGSGYLHDENDDTPYDVDGVVYCGRCHRFIENPHS